MKFFFSLILLSFSLFSEVRSQFSMSFYGKKQGLDEPILKDFTLSPDGNIWIASETAIIKYDGKKFSRFSLLNEKNYSPIKQIRYHNNHILILSEKSMFTFDGQKFKSYFHSDSLRLIEMDQSGGVITDYQYINPDTIINLNNFKKYPTKNYRNIWNLNQNDAFEIITDSNYYYIEDNQLNRIKFSANLKNKISNPSIRPLRFFNNKVLVHRNNQILREYLLIDTAGSEDLISSSNKPTTLSWDFIENKERNDFTFITSNGNDYVISSENKIKLIPEKKEDPFKRLNIINDDYGIVFYQDKFFIMNIHTQSLTQIKAIPSDVDISKNFTDLQGNIWLFSPQKIIKLVPCVNEWFNVSHFIDDNIIQTGSQLHAYANNNESFYMRFLNFDSFGNVREKCFFQLNKEYNLIDSCFDCNVKTLFTVPNLDSSSWKSVAIETIVTNNLSSSILNKGSISIPNSYKLGYNLRLIDSSILDLNNATLIDINSGGIKSIDISKPILNLVRKENYYIIFSQVERNSNTILYKVDLNFNLIDSMYLDKNHSLLQGSKSNNLWLFSIKNNLIEIIDFNTKSIQTIDLPVTPKNRNSVQFDDNGNLWIQTNVSIANISLNEVNEIYSIKEFNAFKELNSTPRSIKISDKTLMLTYRNGSISTIDLNEYYNDNKFVEYFINIPLGNYRGAFIGNGKFVFSANFGIRNNYLVSDLKNQTKSIVNYQINFDKIDVNDKTIYQYSSFTHLGQKLPNIRTKYNKYSKHSFYFTSNSHSNNVEKLYYKLDGYSIYWDSTETNQISFNNLPPGDYTLRAKADTKGQYSPEVSFSFKVLTPFYQTVWFKIVIGLIVIILMITVYKARTKHLHHRQKKLEKEINNATVEIREQRDEIIDSINYAKRIQSAILPPNNFIKEHLQNSFILYKPKDIVAGDFYWMEVSKGSTSSSNEEKVLFAAADCTGHGVPGAMVSVICNNALNRSVREYELSDPADILGKTREIVIQEFEKSEEDVKDGMDIALCSLEGNILKYAGAHNPLWIIRNKEIIETKANKQPIGKFDNLLPYTTHTFELEKGDTIYIFSDGYPDQFGGERGKKYKSGNFKKLLLSIQDYSMEAQHELLDEEFEKWRGKIEQIDDVCVIGVKV